MDGCTDDNHNHVNKQAVQSTDKHIKQNNKENHECILKPQDMDNRVPFSIQLDHNA